MHGDADWHWGTECFMLSCKVLDFILGHWSFYLQDEVADRCLREKQRHRPKSANLWRCKLFMTEKPMRHDGSALTNNNHSTRCWRETSKMKIVMTTKAGLKHHLSKKLLKVTKRALLNFPQFFVAWVMRGECVKWNEHGADIC